MTSTKLHSELNDTARQVFAVGWPEIAERTNLEVRYFGRGNKYELRRSSNGGWNATVYYHASSGAAGLPKILKAIAEEIKFRDSQSVRIRRETLRKLAENESLSHVERREVAEALRSGGN